MLKLALVTASLALVAAVASAKDDTSVPTGSGTCTLVGTWRGTYACPALHGKPYQWIINGDGTASGTIDGRIPIRQTWSMSGATVTIHDVGSDCGGAGTYTVAFEDGCAKMKLTRQADACPVRGDCVGGLTGARQR